MFEDLRNAFREAVQNFKDEIGRDDVPETMNRLMKGMVDEVTNAKSSLAGLEDDVDKTGKVLEKLNTELATYRRREQMAREIADEETARIAAEFSEKIEGRITIQQKKLEVLTAEASQLRAEIDSMMAQIKDARDRRSGLTAEAGRKEAREAIGESQDLFDALDRMGSKIEGDEYEADAYADVDAGGTTSEFSIDLDAPTGPPERDYDAALEELKRRMGKD